jgi:putative membrane protein
MATEPPAPPERRGIHVPVWALITLGAIVALAIGFGIGRATNNGRHQDDGFRRFGNHGGRGLGLLFLIVIVVLIGIGIYMLVRHFANRPVEAAAEPSATRAAEQILAERLARGEIDDTEYRARRDALQG